MNTTDSFGYWVRRQRKALDMTQEELARRVGCAVVTLRKIEADARHPSPQMAERLAGCLELPETEWAWFVATAVGQRPTTHLPLPTEPTMRRMPGNLPAPVTSLIGRTAEIATITDCLRHKEVRLMTLTGPVGVGKTRLAVAVGRQLLPTYQHGVYLVELAAVADPDQVAAATAVTLGTREVQGQNPAQTVFNFLAAREMLLIFDNFEHLLPAAPFLAALLAQCPQLQLLVTSRACLHLYGEHEVAVSPLPLPAPDSLLPDAVNSPAVQLFCARARAVCADFHLTPSLTPAVADICRRLDGLPLAIELTAAHTKLFSPPELARRLEQRLPLPNPGAADLSPRQQGLESAIAWSYGLLSPWQRLLLARLAVFSGSFTLAAAEAVGASAVAGSHSAAKQEVTANTAGDAVADAAADTAVTLMALLDQSLLVRQSAAKGNGGVCCPHCPTRQLREIVSAEPRFTMLAVIRDYALNRLEMAQERAVVQERHARYFTGWVAHATAQLHGPEQGIWLARLECEADNLRAALKWLLAAGQLEMAAQLVCHLGKVWQRHGRYSEGRGWMDQILACLPAHPLPDVLRARLLQTAAMLAYRQGKWPIARQELTESLTLYQAANDDLGIASVFFDLGWIALDQGEWTDAIHYNQESLTLARMAGDPVVVYRALTNLGWAQLCQGCHEEAALFFDEAYEQAQQVGHTRGVAVSLVNRAWIALAAGEMAEAARLVQAGLRLCHLLAEREVLAEGLEILAATAVADGNARRAAKLGGATAGIWESLQVARPPVHHHTVSFAELMANVRHQLSEAEFAAAWEQGRRMNLDVMTVFALHCQGAAVANVNS